MSKLEVISFNKQIFHAVSLSGGKNSTAMLLLMIERDLPINTVLWADTGMEFPEMYDHISKVDDYLYRERGIIKALGVIILGWGIVQVGMSIQSHDASQRTQGFLCLFGGLMIAFAKEILTAIGAI